MAQIVVWGTGGTTEGRFKPSKTVASAAIMDSKRITWDSGSATGVNLTYSLKESYLYHEAISRCSAGFVPRWFGIYYFLSPQIGRWAKSSDVFTFTSFLTGCCPYDYHAIININGSPINPMPLENNCGRQMRRSAVTLRAFQSSDSSPIPTNPYSGGSVGTGSAPALTTIPPVKFFGGKIVISGSSQDGEYALIDPSSISISQNKVIAVTYSDNTKTEIPLSSAPAWVRLEDDSQCPAGSCECVHDGYKCCIDPVSGVVVKKIRI